MEQTTIKDYCQNGHGLCWALIYIHNSFRKYIYISLKHFLINSLCDHIFIFFFILRMKSKNNSQDEDVNGVYSGTSEDEEETNNATVSVTA